MLQDIVTVQRCMQPILQLYHAITSQSYIDQKTVLYVRTYALTTSTNVISDVHWRHSAGAESDIFCKRQKDLWHVICFSTQDQDSRTKIKKTKTITLIYQPITDYICSSLLLLLQKDWRFSWSPPTQPYPSKIPWRRNRNRNNDIPQEYFWSVSHVIVWQTTELSNGTWLSSYTRTSLLIPLGINKTKLIDARFWLCCYQTKLHLADIWK